MVNGTHLPIRLIEEQLRKLKETGVETLMISGSLDVSTPKEGAEKMLPYFTRCQHVVLSERGHLDKFKGQSAAARHMITTYYNTGIGHSSQFKYVPMNFMEKGILNFPLLAKLWGCCAKLFGPPAWGARIYNLETFITLKLTTIILCIIMCIGRCIMCGQIL